MVEIAAALAQLQGADAHTIGTELNRIADRYRGGGDLRTLVPLLTGCDAFLVECAAWIASEAVSGSRGRDIFKELVALMDHESPTVRFSAVDSVFTLARSEERSILHHAFLKAMDPDAGVRLKVLTRACTAPDATVRSLEGTSEWAGARLLLTASKDEIVDAMTSGSSFERCMASAAAIKHYKGDESFISSILTYMDEEVRGILPLLRKV